MEQVRREPGQCRPQLGEFVREQRRLGSMSLRKLSELSGVSNPYLSQIERGLRRPSAEVLQHLARALEVPAEWLYVRAGILPDEPRPGGVADAIRRAGELTEPQKRALLHVYEAFRATAGAGESHRGESG